MAESLAFELPVGGTVSLAFALYIAGLLYAGPLPAVLMAVVGAVPPQDFRKHKSLFRMLFNITMFALSVLVAGIVFLELGGVPLVYARVTSTITPSVLTPVLAAAMTMHLLNTTLFSAVVSLSTGIPMLRVWREQNLASYLASFVVLALLGFGMAQLIDVAGWSAAALLVVPFAVARQTFQVYNQLTNAYSETIRSFVAAIEAKDPYTRGHSERVAQYSRRIAELRGLKGRNLERVEYAALLHDVGKIGVRRGILTKPGRLTDEELAEIHSHPEAGCKILGSVDFLEDIVPFVRAHHERIDGTGYPDGQTGQAIPLEARMLAVADAYDAMTSNRPYREALSHDAALSELRRVAGTQLDPVFVSALADNFEAQERGVES
ncbi:MAG: HD-GYP domain-containing protein [Coriobacteriia bacterium]|nr:HD-GYP domain-containing protein [Coriobacteriia bacterium]